MGALSDQDQNDVNQATTADFAEKRNSPDDSGGALTNPAAAYGSGANAATDDQGNPGEYSPQDMRTLQLLDNVRGQMAPKHTGASLLEGYGQAAENQYKTLSGVLSANAKARAALALQGMKTQGQLGVAGVGADAKRDVAMINVGGKMVKPLSEQDARAMGFNVPAGWTGYINNFGKPTTLTRPSSNQEMMVDDGKGGTTYAAPGQALTTAQRTQHQSYLSNADPVMKELDETNPDSLISRLGNADSKTSLGGPGMLERGEQNVAGLFGMASQPNPEDTKLRADIADFNIKAAPLLRNGAGTDKLSPAQLDQLEHSSLPDPTNHLESFGSANAKIMALKKTIHASVKSSQDALQGHGSFGGGATGSYAAAPTNAQDPKALIAHAQDAIARGAPKDKVLLQLKQMGVDTAGIQ